MTKQSTDIQRLVREYRKTRSPVQVSMELAKTGHKGITASWLTPGRAAFTTALSMAILLFVIVTIDNQPAYEQNQAYPSISLLSDAGISLSIDTGSPGISGISGMENMPGLMDISIPHSLKAPAADDEDQQTKFTEPHSSKTIT
jgi:hypothetical protein